MRVCLHKEMLKNERRYNSVPSLTWLMFRLVIIWIISRFIKTTAFAEMSGGLTTCYTCTDAPSNYHCNKYALDVPCEQGVVCQTVHKMDTSGMTMAVTKRCVSTDDCNDSLVGCSTAVSDGVQTCTACCDESYCNEFVPTNSSTATALWTGGRSIGVTIHVLSPLHVLQILLPVYLTLASHSIYNNRLNSVNE